MMPHSPPGTCQKWEHYHQCNPGLCPKLKDKAQGTGSVTELFWKIGRSLGRAPFCCHFVL